MKYLSKITLIFSIIMLTLFFYAPSANFFNSEINSVYYYGVLILQLLFLAMIDALSPNHPRIARLLPLGFFWPIVLAILATPLLQEAAGEFFIIFLINSILLMFLFAIVTKTFTRVTSEAAYYLIFTFFLLTSLGLAYVNQSDFGVAQSGLDNVDRSVAELKMRSDLNSDQKFQELDQLGTYCNKIYSPIKKANCISDFSAKIKEVKYINEQVSGFTTDPEDCNKMETEKKYACQRNIVRNTIGNGADDISVCEKFDKGNNANDSRPAEDLTSDDCYAHIAEFQRQGSFCNMIINDTKKMNCYYTLIHDTRDPSICSQIPDQKTRDLLSSVKICPVK
ncbi:MAG: hypothetical protein WCG97_02020 [bacterium]